MAYKNTSSASMFVREFILKSCRQWGRRVEHVFGFMEQSMIGLVFIGVGMTRAKVNIAMTNLVYNMCRLAYIETYHADYLLLNN